MKKGERWSKKHRKLMMRIMRSKEYREKITKGNIRRYLNPEERKKARERWTEKKREEQGRMLKRVLRKLYTKKERKEHGRRMKELMKKIWTKEKRKEQSIRMRKIMENPEIRKKLIKKLKERYKKHPYLKIKLSKEKQEYYEKNPAARKNLLEYWKKPERKVRAMNNLIVKSEGEKIIANTLYKNNIIPNYESVELNFKEMDPIPDFFPEGEYEEGDKARKIKNVFIEFYGGHPKSYKTKLKKNKLYRKYKIPVFILTPYELKLPNFSSYLLSQLSKLSQSKEARNFNLARWKLKRK